GPIFDMGYPYNLKPVRASRDEYAVVTGASKGMGRQFAMKLAKAGWSLVISARNEKLLNELKDVLVKTYGPSCKVIVVACDLSFTLAVLNAGGMYSCDIVNLEPEKLEAQIRLNVIQQGDALTPGAMNDTNFSVAAGCKASPLFTLFDMPSDKCTDGGPLEASE
ncbi:hypothetical protein FOZ60_001292, partial [Perkinsus olseni]